MRENLSRSLFSDQKANHVGDAVTILVMETSSASNTAQTTASRVSNLSLAGTASLSANAATVPGVGATLGTHKFFYRPGSDIERRVDSGTSQRNGRFSASERKSLCRWESDDHHQWRRTNHQDFRSCAPSDIQPDNSVYSYNISDATIIFKGNGIVSRAQEPGWLTKFFHWIF